MKNSATKKKLTPIYLILTFLLFTIVIIITGLLYSKTYEKNYRKEVEQQLSAIADLKISQMVAWRKERLSDAKLFYKNEAFTEHVINYLKNPNDLDAKTNIQVWLNKVKTGYNYDAAFLCDTSCIKRIIISERTECPKTIITPPKYDSLKLNKIVFQDFYLDDTIKKIFLNILVPITDKKNNNQLIAWVELRIDPDMYLYPLINIWPTPSKTAETLIAKRDGDSAEYLNTLKFRKNTALKLHIPLNRKDILIVKAVLGEKGIVEGLDYKGDEVIGYARPVPNAPWFMVARMNKEELFEPLKEKQLSLLVFIVSLILVLGSVGAFLWWQQIIKNYKDKVAAAAAIIKKEESLQFALETTKSGAWDLNLLDGTASRTLMHDQIFGYESLLPKWTYEMFLEHVLPEDRPEVERSFGEAIATVSDWNFECRILRADGELRWISANGGHKKNQEGKPSLMSGLVHDITIRKQAEESLQIKNQMFEDSLVSQSYADSTGTIILVNNAFLHMWDYTSKEQVKGNSVGSLFADPADAVQVLEALASHNKWEGEFRAKRNDGTTFVCYGLATSIRNKQGKLIGYQSTNLNITNETEAREVIHKLNAELEDRVVQRTIQLETANKELEAFSYSVSHDLRAPLRAVHSYTNILLEDYDKFLDDEGKRICGIISSSAIQMGKLIDDLLSFSRIGRSTVKFELVDMKSLATSVINEICGEKPISRINLELGKLSKAYCDPNLIRIVWTNLISNAIKYSSKKPLSEIVISSIQKDHIVTYSVKDNGAGFDMLHVHKLFGVFQRLHGMSEFEGTGVGLAIVQSVILKHGGNVWAEGEVGKGATFYFSLPVSEKTN